MTIESKKVGLGVIPISYTDEDKSNYLNPDDAQINAERDLVERLFSCETLRESNFADRELDIRRIAASLFMTYFDAEQRDDVLFGPGWSTADVVVEEYCAKADKIYEFAGDYETSKKILRLLQSVDPKVSVKLVEGL